MSPEEEQQSSIADDLVRRSALHAFILESPGGTSTETIGIPASCDVSPTQESVLFQGEQPRMHSLEELKEEPRVGTVDQQKENIEDLSSVIITTATSEEPRNIDHDQVHDLDDIHGLLDEINSITLDDPKDDYLLEPGDDLDGHLTDSTWGYVPHVTLWDSADNGAGFVIDFENLTSLLPSCSDGGLTRGSYSKEEQQGSTSHDFNSMEKTESGATGMLAQEELCAPTRAPDDSNIEGYNNYHCSIVPGMNIDANVGEGNVDGDPPKRSEYDQINEGEAITITNVLAGTDVKEKDNTVIVATESDAHIKIIGYNCGYYYDCDYWHEYDLVPQSAFLFLAQPYWWPWEY